MTEPIKTHDLTKRGWGHDFSFAPLDAGGARGRLNGWRRGLTAGDFVVLPNGKETTRYRVVKIRYALDPPDQFFAEVEFAPRQAAAA